MRHSREIGLDSSKRRPAIIRLTALTLTGLTALAAPISIGLLSSCSAAAAPQVKSATYNCNAGRSFGVRSDDKHATIEYSGQRYSLPRRPSSIGYKYASPAATLIIDGDVAVFVTEAIVDLGGCYEVR